VPLSSDDSTVDPRLPVPEEVANQWSALAVGFRLQEAMLNQVVDPAPTSNLAAANALYPLEKVSDWCRDYLTAGLEHALLWADHTQPLKFTEDHQVDHRFRPAQTLGRATLEAASQAVWVLGGGSTHEFAKRHLRLIRWDYSERKKSLSLDEKPTMVEADRLLGERARPHFTADDLAVPNGYLFVIREAASIVGVDPDETEAIWRAASGSAHGRRWPAAVLQRVIAGQEYEPGKHRAMLIPDPEAITRVMAAASAVSMQGVLRYLHSAGVDIEAAREQAIQSVGATLPLKPGVDRDDLLRRRPEEF
jgi:hypothetical protein